MEVKSEANFHFGCKVTQKKANQPIIAQDLANYSPRIEPICKFLIGQPSLLHLLHIETIVKERGLKVVLERRPITAYRSVVGNDGLEDAAVVVGKMPVFSWQHDVATLIADEVFVVWRNQEELATTESPCAALVSQIELPTLPPLHMDAVPQECDALSAVADVQT